MKLLIFCIIKAAIDLYKSKAAVFDIVFTI